MDKYILDANIFITPYRQYYPFDIAKGFWNQMEDCLKQENVILLDVVKNEICKLEDDLSSWLTNIDQLNIVSVQQLEIIQRYGEVLSYLQESPKYQEAAFRNWAAAGIADGWIIAAAMELGATVITTEGKSGPISEKNPARNAKIPDVSAHFDVRCENLFYFMRQMRFKL